jgi:NADH:ubiquinone oxidoreductase subunit F (NADH-binding)
MLVKHHFSADFQGAETVWSYTLKESCGSPKTDRGGLHRVSRHFNTFVSGVPVRKHSFMLENLFVTSIRSSYICASTFGTQTFVIPISCTFLYLSLMLCWRSNFMNFLNILTSRSSDSSIL